jgi:hypothetical protein
MIILIDSPGAKTQVNVINGVLDLSMFSDPTPAILQAAFDAGDYEIIPDPEPVVAPVIPNWLQFYNSLKMSATFQQLMDLTAIAPNISGVMAAMGFVIQDGIRDPFSPDIDNAFQSSVNGVLNVLNAIEQPLSPEQSAEIRELLDDNGFQSITLG